MADTAFITQYREQFIEGFEQHQSLLRETVTTEAVIKGNQAQFLVVDSGAATAVTRGVNGLIPARADNMNPFIAVLTEQHDLVRKTSFNIFASQGNQRAAMQMTSMAVINRKIDSQIINELNSGTITVGAASAVPTVSLFQNARVKVANAAVPYENMTLLCNPSFTAFLEQAPEFVNAQLVDVKPYAGNSANVSWRDRKQAYYWRKTLIIEHPNLPGKATASEKNFLYHKWAIGQAANVDQIGDEDHPMIGYNEEQDYSWCRTSIFCGAKLLQNTGVVILTTDGTVYG